jgi:hypothetical protein
VQQSTAVKDFETVTVSPGRSNSLPDRAETSVAREKAMAGRKISVDNRLIRGPTTQKPYGYHLNYVPVLTNA